MTPRCGRCRSKDSVLSGLFDAIDDHDVDWPSLGLELESELFLQRREERRHVGIDRRRPAPPGRGPGPSPRPSGAYVISKS